MRLAAILSLIIIAMLAASAGSSNAQSLPLLQVEAPAG